MKRTLLALTSSLVVLLLLAGTARAQTSYVLGAQDVITVTDLGEEDLSRKYTIEQDGTFTFPLIGRVTAKGLTLRELEGELTRKLVAGKFYNNPEVSVAIDAYQSQRITVVGKVNAPGEYPLTSDMTLLSALAKAGFVTPDAGREALVVRKLRSGSDENEIVRVDLVKLQAGDMSLNLVLRDGDTINVPKAQMAFVNGQVKSPGAYPVENGMTVLQFLSLAGGLTDRGSDKRINILRVGTEKELKGVKLTDLVEPGDTITVGSRIW